VIKIDGRGPAALRCDLGDQPCGVSPFSAEGFTIPLPCQNWSLQSQGLVHKYADPSGATCRVVILRHAVLQKAVCKGPQVDYDLGADQGSIGVKIRGGTEPWQWCTEFNATTAGCTVVKDGSDDRKYLAKGCTAAPATCVASPDGAFVELADPF
jgi:hypothetical protein